MIASTSVSRMGNRIIPTTMPRAFVLSDNIESDYKTRFQCLLISLWSKPPHETGEVSYYSRSNLSYLMSHNAIGSCSHVSKERCHTHTMCKRFRRTEISACSSVHSVSCQVEARDVTCLPAEHGLPGCLRFADALRWLWSDSVALTEASTSLPLDAQGCMCTCPNVHN